LTPLMSLPDLPDAVSAPTLRCPSSTLIAPRRARRLWSPPVFRRQLGRRHGKELSGVGRFAAVMNEGTWWGIAAGVTQVAVALLPIIAAGADLLVAEGLSARDADASPLRKATIAVGRALACGGVWVLGLIGLAYVWGVYLLTPETGPAQVAARALVTIGIALVTGWTLWRFASVYLAEHAPKPRIARSGMIPTGPG
jgi:hypothetical protein